MCPLGPDLLFEAAIMPEPTYRCAFASPNAKALRNTIRSRCALHISLVPQKPGAPHLASEMWESKSISHAHQSTTLPINTNAVAQYAGNH
jgi:molybdopterin-biosynthesis enzyme MoeA-like protein